MKFLMMMLLLGTGCGVVGAAEQSVCAAQDAQPERKLTIVYADQLTPEECQLINRSYYIGFTQSQLLDQRARDGRPCPQICRMPSPQENQAFRKMSIVEQAGEPIYELSFTAAELASIKAQVGDNFVVLIQTLTNRLLEVAPENRQRYESPKNWCGTGAH